MSASPKNTDLHQEEDRLPNATLLLTAIFMALVLALLVAWAWYSLQQRERVLRPSHVFPERNLGPRHAVDEELEDIFGNKGRGEVLNERKRKEISSFHWVDRQKRVVSIPVDDAIDLLLTAKRHE
jgi:hypothetical protein